MENGQRFCRHCNPPPHEWNTSPPTPDAPQGNLQHLLLECPKFTHLRRHENTLNILLTGLMPPQKQQDPQPWTRADTLMQTRLLCASMLPTEWQITKKSHDRWIPLIEPILEQWIKPIHNDSLAWIHATAPNPVAT